MGFISTPRRGSAAQKEERRTSIADFEASLDDQLQSAEIDDKEREGVQRERASFDSMTDKEKMRWIEFKKNGGFKNRDCAAGMYPGGRCC
jgi:hypothetical protein